MVKALVLVSLIAACTTDNGNGECAIGKTVLEMCGPAPLAPGWAVTYVGDSYTMSTTDYDKITAWSETVAKWRDCTVGL